MNGDEIRELERSSIHSWVEQNAFLLTGRVLDFGAGREPYRDLVTGDYVPFDRMDYPGSCAYINVGPTDPFWEGEWDAILCTQVLQYLADPAKTLRQMREALAVRRGHLILTYATNWPEVEPSDLWRYTGRGIERLLEKAGFEVLRNEPRGGVGWGGFQLSLGGGAVARARP